MRVEKVWKRREPDIGRVRELHDTLDCDPIVAHVLVNRGIDDVDLASRFLEPSLDDLHDPGQLPDMELATERLDGAIERDETIAVYGDRDVDGTAGTAILLELLGTLGTTVGYQFPRKYDGHGLHPHLVDRLARRDVDLLVTVDCGMGDHDAHRRADAANIDVLVVDHHPPEGDSLPVEACVNPRREASEYPHEELAAGAVAYKLGEALIERRGTDVASYRAYGLPLAGLATVADHVPITLENRAIARAGYERLDGCPLRGLRALTEHCEVESLRDLGWSLAPLLNAAREDASGDLMLQMLLAEEPSRIETLIDELVTYREQTKAERRERIEELGTCVEEQVAPDDAVYAVQTSGYVGSAAATVADRFGKPLIAYYSNKGGYRGVARTDLDIDLRALIASCEDLVEEYWGHPGAPGFHVDPSNLEDLIETVDRELSRRYTEEDLTPTIEIDAVLPPTDITDDLLAGIDRLRPFGDGHEEPRLLVEGVQLEAVESFGSDGQHARFDPRDATFQLLWWNGAHGIDEWQGSGRYDVVGTVARDSYKGGIAMSVEDLAFVA